MLDRMLDELARPAPGVVGRPGGLELAVFATLGGFGPRAARRCLTTTSQVPHGSTEKAADDAR